MVLLCEPTSISLIKALDQGIYEYKNFSASDFNLRVSKYYSWRNVAQRTERVYHKVLQKPRIRMSDIVLEIAQTPSHFMLLFFYGMTYLLSLIMN